MKTADKIDIGAKLVLYGFGFLALKKIAEVFGIVQSAEDKAVYFNINKAYNNEAFNRDFMVMIQRLSLKPEFKGMSVKSFIDLQADKTKCAQIAVEIYTAVAGAGTDEIKIFSQLRRLSNKVELGLLNSVFLALYKVSLIDFLADELSDADLSKAAVIINNLPEYTKQ